MGNTDNSTVLAVLPRYKGGRLWGVKIGPRWCVLGRIFILPQKVLGVDVTARSEGMLVGCGEDRGRSTLKIWWDNHPYQPIVDMHGHEVTIQRHHKNPWRQKGFGYDELTEARPLTKLDQYYPSARSSSQGQNR